ncbi:hypothetical protein ACIPSA_49445 [Streptomyces sp. NPDC086549]|uniref:hypothetical protein n=1 Tax=Streptomyces sp. NPDC086549 TaxID=3365752 RepID=UPI003823F16B
MPSTRNQSSHILLPGPGVGTEACTIGTAIDYRLRLAFTAAQPVDPIARAGFLLISSDGSEAGRQMRAVGEELAERLKETVLRRHLDNRELPMDRAHDEEEDLARLLIAAAWYQVNYRTPIGFAYTPLAITAREDPAAFTLERLLDLPHRDMVTDLVAQLHKASEGPLAALRARTRPEDCTPALTFPTDRIALTPTWPSTGCRSTSRAPGTRARSARPKRGSWPATCCSTQTTATGSTQSASTSRAPARWPAGR